MTEQVARTRIENGVLGDVRFDTHGGFVEGPVSVFRVEGDEVSTYRVLTVSEEK